MDHFALPDDELALARENGTLQRNFQGEVIMALMRHGRIDMAHFERRYDIDFARYFAESLDQLAGHVADGLVTIENGTVTLLPQGQLMMRSVAMAFDAYLGEGQRGMFSRTV